MERLFRYTLTFLLSVVAILEVVQVIARYILQIPIMGLEELIVYPALWLYILGSVEASREDTQLEANVLDVFISNPKTLFALHATAKVISIVVCSWLTWWAWDYFKYAKRVWKDSPTLYIPTFYAECAIFIGLLLMLIFTVNNLIKLARNQYRP